MIRMNSFYGFTVLFIFSGLFLMLGCSGDNQSGKSDSVAEVNTAGDPDKEQIKAMLYDAIERLHYDDKGGLYDNEFEYLKELYTFDEYLKHQYIRAATADTVESFTVLDINLYDRDSARVRDRVVFVGLKGDTFVIHNEYIVYYHQGRWIKPTISSIYKQKDFEEKKKKSGDR